MVGLLVTCQVSSHVQRFTTIFRHARHKMLHFFASTLQRSSSTEPLLALLSTIHSILTAPLQRYSASQRDIQWNHWLPVTLVSPPGISVNDGIPRDEYLSEPYKLRLPGLDRPGCLVFKTDLRCAYRQIPIDPYNLSFPGNNSWQFHVIPCNHAL